jgi:hypothetical protein
LKPFAESVTGSATDSLPNRRVLWRWKLPNSWNKLAADTIYCCSVDVGK